VEDWLTIFCQCAVVAAAVLTATKDTQFAALMSWPGSLGRMNAGTKCARSGVRGVRTEDRERRTLQVIAIDDAAADGESMASTSNQQQRATSNMQPAACQEQPATRYCCLLPATWYPFINAFNVSWLRLRLNRWARDLGSGGN